MIAFVFLNKESFNQESITKFLLDYGDFAKLIFVLIYIVAALAFLPSFVFTMIGGLLFGTLTGGILSLVGASLGAALSFIVSRYIASDWLEQSSSELLQKLRNGTTEKGWRYVAFTRLVPVFPYNLQNYGYGLTKISCWQFSLTTFLTMAPSTFIYAYLGNHGKTILF